jgi:SNF2 family DNA or RNA helicase
MDWKAEEEEHNSDDDDDMVWDDETGDWASAKKIKERQPLVEGAVTRLHQAICEAQHPPTRSEWSKFMVENFTEGAIAQSKFGSSSLTVKPEVPGGNRKGAPVDQLDLATGMLIHTWKSTNAACMALNVTAYQITQCCYGRMGDAGGFRWRYADPATSLSAKGGDEDEVEPVEREDAEEVAERESVWKAKLHKKSKEYRSGGTLREYQVEGLNWLLRCWYQRRSCIIADEM